MTYGPNVSHAINAKKRLNSLSKVSRNAFTYPNTYFVKGEQGTSTKVLDKILHHFWDG